MIAPAITEAADELADIFVELHGGDALEAHNELRAIATTSKDEATARVHALAADVIQTKYTSHFCI